MNTLLDYFLTGIIRPYTFRLIFQNTFCIVTCYSCKELYFVHDMFHKYDIS